jgi:hypothetical protein
MRNEQDDLGVVCLTGQVIELVSFKHKQISDLLKLGPEDNVWRRGIFT